MKITLEGLRAYNWGWRRDRRPPDAERHEFTERTASKRSLWEQARSISRRIRPSREAGDFK